MSTIIKEVIPVIEYSVRQLCLRPYPGRSRGCPNYNNRKRCPPKAPRFEDYFDLDKPFYAIINVFDLQSHADKMKQRHPDWSEKQLRNLLYWQPTARKELKNAVFDFLKKNKKYRISICPEAMGINVFKTMNTIGIQMEWPPKTISYQIAIAGVRKRNRDTNE